MTTFCFYYVSFAAKVYGVPLQIDRDGCEGVLMVLNLAFYGLRIFALPLFLGFVLFTDNPVSNLANLVLRVILEILVGSNLATKWLVQPIFVTIVCIVGVQFAMSGLYSVFLFINFALTYVNGTRLWMLKLG